MKRLAYIFLATPLLFAACSNDDEIIEESVEFTINASLPQKLATRASGDEINVNKVVCATFENNIEIQSLRQTIDIVDGQQISYSPRLIKGHKYRVAFWAMKDNAYDLGDWTNIHPTDIDGISYNGAPAIYECFTNSTDEFTVTGNNNVAITLTRPMARINLGVTDADMTAVRNLGYAPTKVQFTIDAASEYNALTKQCGTTTSSQTLTVPVADGVLNVGGTDYESLASYMVFTDGSNVNLSYTVYGKRLNDSGEPTGDEISITTNSIDNIPLGVNKNTNIVGELLTGTISYSISLENAYGEDNNLTT